MQTRSPYFDVDCRDIANNVVLVVHHGKGGNAFFIHKLEGFPERPVTTGV